MDRARYRTELIRFANQRLCAHCGERVETGDIALPPLALRPLLRIMKLADRRSLPSCRECAEFAKSSSAITFGGQRRYIARRIAERYWRFLEIPQWDREELEELGYNLRQTVSAGVTRREWLERRIAWPRRPKSENSR